MYLKLDDPAFRLSEHSDLMPRLPEGIDWSAFTGLDPTPFRTMAANVRAAHAARNTPPQKPLTAPCALRQLVASTRASVVDPVLSAFRLPEDLAALSSDDDEPDPEAARRAREREKIRELKKRVQATNDVLQMEELKCRKRVLRRLGFTNSADIVDMKGRVACEISTGDELLLTELIFNGAFNALSPEQCAGLLSCFVFTEKVSWLTYLYAL